MCRCGATPRWETHHAWAKPLPKPNLKHAFVKNGKTNRGRIQRYAGKKPAKTGVSTANIAWTTVQHTQSTCLGEHLQMRGAVGRARLLLALPYKANGAETVKDSFSAGFYIDAFTSAHVDAAGIRTSACASGRPCRLQLVARPWPGLLAGLCGGAWQVLPLPWTRA